MSGMRAAHALHRLSGEYIGLRRSYGDLRTRLVGVAHERAKVSAEGGGDIEAERLTERARRQLEEIEHVRGTLERSARAVGERVRAMEAVIAAVVIEAGSTAEMFD